MSNIYVGLMSGTSMDAVDGVAADFSGTAPTLLSAVHSPLPVELKIKLLTLSQGGSHSLAELAWCDVEIGRVFADAALSVIETAGIDAADVRAIGSHGQTIFHEPQGTHRTSMQIGDPNIIAERTSITTIADFRRRDMAAGGQGAPLVPAFHHAVFGNSGQTRVVANIGGMANITILPRGGGHITGFDTGPGNVLMDAWIDAVCRQPFDRDGGWAATGSVLPELLERLLADDYFDRPPPKSTGREHFNLQWLKRHLDAMHMQCDTSETARDIQRTLCELTAISVADAVRKHAADAKEIIVCGGGALNTLLCERLQTLASRPVISSATLGIDPQHVEALAFAWLAQQTLHGRPGNLPSVTGAQHPVVLGAIYHGRNA